MKKKWAWLIVLTPLVLDGLTEFPGFPAIFTETTTHYAPYYVEGGSRLMTTTSCGIPFMSRSSEVRTRQSSADTETRLDG